MNVEKMQALVYEIRNLKSKAEIYTKANEYVYTNVYSTWVNEYNALLDKYNALSELRITKMTFSENDLSSTQKTIRQATILYYISAIEALANKIESDIERERLSKLEEQTPSHQMRKCFKLCVDGCPVNPDLKRNRVFIAMPFSNEYLDSYNYGIVPALDSLGYEHFKADNELSNKDIMCKICREIQSCSLAIINISSLNPNVMLEQGLAYGLGKPVIIIKDKNTKAVSDIGSIEYIEYEHAYDLQQKLSRALEK
ncbi:MAG: hypothetical protein EOM61_04225 [Bacteroidia bacterium]|nr:hypothetical protein [Bacteroidia bacterium]